MTQKITTIEEVLYTAKAHTVGGRDGGEARTSDGRLEVKLSKPGSARPGTNPEQLFAVGWSACFLSAMQHIATKYNSQLPVGAAVDAEIDLARANGGFLLQARLHVSLPGLDPAVAEALIERAHEECPYSKATRGNINTVISVATHQPGDHVA